jgi:hypothetical protein
MTKPFVNDVAVEHLARAAGIEIPPGRRAIVAERLNEMFALAADIETIPYRHLPPAMIFEASWDIPFLEDEEEL